MSQVRYKVLRFRVTVLMCLSMLDALGMDLISIYVPSVAAEFPWMKRLVVVNIRV